MPQAQAARIGGTPQATPRLPPVALAGGAGQVRQVWICNYTANTILIYNADGTPTGQVLSSNSVSTPTAAGRINGEIWVCNRLASNVSRFNPDGSAAGPVISGNSLNNPWGVVQVGPTAWVLNESPSGASSAWSVFSAASGAAVATYATTVATNSIFTSPLVLVDGVGYCSSGLTGSTNGIAFNALDGSPVSAQWTIPAIVGASARGAIAVGAALWFLDVNNNQILVLPPLQRVPQTTLSVAALRTLTGHGLSSPHQGCLVNQQVWVPNFGNNTLNIYATDGTFLRSIATSTLSGPRHALALP